MSRLMLAARVVFGFWMLLSGLDHFVGPFVPLPAPSQPLAIQFMDALHLSGLIDVAKAIQLVAGALILARLLAPLALCIVLPVNVCAAYWAAVLESNLGLGLLALIAVALNVLLMLQHLDSYRTMLETRPLALGERDAPGGRYEALYTDPLGATALRDALPALLPLAAAAAFYWFLLPPSLGRSALMLLLIPGAVLLARTAQGFTGRR